MSTFSQFKELIDKQFAYMQEHLLFRVDVDKDKEWETYLNSFAPGTNPIHIERTEHDCTCCKQFIRAVGNVVTIINGSIVSIWDVEAEGIFKPVAQQLKLLNESAEIKDIFLHDQKSAGTDHNHQLVDGVSKRWGHFHVNIPKKFVNTKNLDSVLSVKRSNKEVLKRSLDELSLSALDIVLELIDQNSLYKGDEYKTKLVRFKEIKKAYENTVNKDLFCWEVSLDIGEASKFRNTVIGTLITDISDGDELDVAVKKFETKVAPENYKRSSAVVTQSMINRAELIIEELGIVDSLDRRYAVTSDITINNVIYADRGVKKQLGALDILSKDVAVSSAKFTDVEEVSIATFLESILPKADSIELMLENKHTSNMMSLIAPKTASAPNILKWNNNFSWGYNGDVTDSMKERVAAKGGNIVADLRFSIQWNDGDNNQNDFDAHAYQANGNLIYYSAKVDRSTQGNLDVDITHPGNAVAVENITWTDKSKIPIGICELKVHNYSHNGGRTGFTAQIECEDVIYEYQYTKNIPQGAKIHVADVKWDGEKLTVIDAIKSATATKEVWGINTQQFHKVNMVMLSPNHWDNQTIGNKHWFFILEGCNTYNSTRGLYNEFLADKLHDHRKVFEVLGSKLRVAESPDQLSGLGFSSTKRASVLCKVTGSFNRTIKINF